MPGKPDFVDIVLDSWRFLQREREIKIIAYLILENHLHGIVVGPELADDPLAWRYSSARNYAGQTGLIEVTTDWM